MKEILTSPRMEDIKRIRRKRRIRATILFFIFLIILIGGLSYFSGHKNITINNINITGTRIINSNQIKDKTEEILKGRYLYLFAKSNSLIYPHQGLYNQLRETFPRIEKITINRTGWNTLEIDISERAGSYLYCGSVIPENRDDVGENCYFMNNDGYVFDKAPYFSGNVYFKYYLPTKDESPLSKEIVPPLEFHKLVRFVEGVQALDFKPTHILLNDSGGYLYLDHKEGSSNPYIAFKNDNNLEDILKNLSYSMKKPEFASEINSKYDILSYIDLRFNNKVLYKFNNE